MPRALIILIIAVTAVSGSGRAGMDEDAAGKGLYGNMWRPNPIHEYWDPGAYHEPETEAVEGQFTGAECVDCHNAVTPGITKDWQNSRHAAPASGTEPVTCDACHGNDHQALTFPTPETCGSCHEAQHSQFLDERRYGFPSHALAMERAVDAKHFVDKPKAEVAPCLQCHSVAEKCDSCHTRHRFSAAEARRPEACITCHSGPPHPDDETYFSSAHGRKYLAEGQDWDWSKPLVKGNYPAPTCAYCHMRNGKHQVADKAIWKFGLREVNPLTAENKVKRKRWVAVCEDCHASEDAKAWLRDLDGERKRAWKSLYDAESELKSLRFRGQLYPAAGDRPLYPVNWWERIWPRARIGFYEGQASAFYNVSKIERDYFEMWYFDNLAAYKSAAHGDSDGVDKWHKELDKSLDAIRREAQELRRLDAAEDANKEPFDPTRLWLRGGYTEFNRDTN